MSKKKIIVNVANPLELIEQGIISNDMSKVAEGYKGLTGKAVSPNKEETICTNGQHLIIKKPKTKKVVKQKPEEPVQELKSSVTEDPFLNGAFVRASGKNLFKDEGGVVKIGDEVIGTFEEDKRIDSLIKKSKGDRRAPSREIKMICQKCKRERVISEKEAMRYANPSNENDSRPVFTCC